MLGDLEALHVLEVHAETVARSWPGGSVGSRLFAGTLERLTDRMLGLGVSRDDLAVAQRLLQDPTATFHAPKHTAAWARRAG